MTTALVSTQDLIKVFAKASINKDFKTMEDVLDENGIFEIQNKQLELVETGKYEFLSWYKNILQETTISDCSYDQCIGCSFGHHVVLFNEGFFPRIQKDSSDRSKTGLRIDTNEGKNVKMTFCFVFLKTENKYIFECVGKILNDDIKKGKTFKEALKNFKNNPAYNHFKFDPDNKF
ncbi:MAG: hypothetical protein L0Y61_05915 [Epsilonproteobacteria bacterium]|nr:hypothetical protein [Campylobacterota bacterium]